MPDRDLDTVTFFQRTYLGALTALLLCAQVSIFTSVVTDRISTSDYLALHVTSCSILIGLAIVSRPGDPGLAQFAFQTAAFTALAGPFGTIMITAVALQKGNAATQSSYPTSNFTLLDKPTLQQSAIADGRLRISGAYGIKPLIDVIIEGTQGQKFAALSIVSEHYEPALAPVLKYALKDADASVRVLSATVTAKLHDGFTKRIGAAQSLTIARSQDPLSWLGLAHAHFAYAESGLLEASQMATEIRQALDHQITAANVGSNQSGELNSVDVASYQSFFAECMPPFTDSQVPKASA